MSPQSRVHEKWEGVVRALSLDLNQPVNFVTAKQVKHLAGEEPRIMAKMDSRNDLPSVFRESGVFVLPINNQTYALVRGNGYHDLEPIRSTTTDFPSALPFELVSPSVGHGELQYVNLAYNAGLLEHFLEVDSLFLMVSGRKFSPAFDLRVDGSPVLHVQGVQVEIDAGFEGERTFVALEAKVNWGEDFIVRQLYYPFRFWREVFTAKAVEKTVRPVFFVYDLPSSTFNFWEYRFTEPFDYESIELVRSSKFKLSSRPVDLQRFVDVKADTGSRRSKIVPQADDVSKIGQVPFLASTGIDSAKGLATFFAFDRRQSSYYSQAAEALGLIRSQSGRYVLTELGREFIEKPAPLRNEMLCRLMLQLPIFNEALTSIVLSPQRTITQPDLSDLIRKRGYSGTTLGRRTRTLLAWFEWMERTFGVVEVRAGNVFLEMQQTRLPE